MLLDIMAEKKKKVRKHRFSSTTVTHHLPLTQAEVEESRKGGKTSGEDEDPRNNSQSFDSEQVKQFCFWRNEKQIKALLDYFLAL